MRRDDERLIWRLRGRHVPRQVHAKFEAVATATAQLLPSPPALCLRPSSPPSDTRLALRARLQEELSEEMWDGGGECD